jgi:hypothetical protein
VLTGRLDFPRQLDRPAKQQQFLGRCGLAGVRVRDDRKGAPARNLVGQGAHQSALAIAGVQAVARKQFRCAGTRGWI